MVHGEVFHQTGTQAIKRDKWGTLTVLKCMGQF